MSLPLISPTYVALPKFNPVQQTIDIQKALTDIVSVKDEYKEDTLKLLNQFRDNETARQNFLILIQSAISTGGSGPGPDTRRQAAGFVARYVPIYAALSADAKKAQFDLLRRGVERTDLEKAKKADESALQALAGEHADKKFDEAMSIAKKKASEAKSLIEGYAFKSNGNKKFETLTGVLNNIVVGNLSGLTEEPSVSSPASSGLAVPDASKKFTVVIPPTGTFAFFPDADSITSGSPYAPTIESGKKLTVTYPGFNFTIVVGGKDKKLAEKSVTAIAQADETQAILLKNKEAEESRRRLFAFNELKERSRLLWEAKAVLESQSTSENSKENKLNINELTAQIYLTELALNDLSKQLAKGEGVPQSQVVAPEKTRQVRRLENLRKRKG